MHRDLTIERFWGWTENEREVKMDMEEMVGKLRRGEPLYGRSEMDLYHQQVAASQSRYAQLKFRIPQDVGVDLLRYLSVLQFCKSFAAWGRYREVYSGVARGGKGEG